MPTYPVHPIANLIPDMTQQEYAELREDIRAQGLRQPITLWKENGATYLLDGRHRDRACDETKRGKHFAEFKGTRDQALAFVISENLRRRHLTEPQRAMIAAKLESMPPHRPTNKDANLHTSRAKAAQLLNVSERTVADAHKVQAKGAPALVAAVEQGKVAISTAAQLADAPPAEQAEIIARGEKEIHAKSKALKAQHKAEHREKRRNQLVALAAKFQLKPPPADPFVEIICGDVRKLDQYVEPASAQLVVTSPPYNVGIEYDGYHDNLPTNRYRTFLINAFKQYHRALCDGGRIAVVVPLGVERSPWRLFAPTIHENLIAAGFTPRGWIIWDKGTAQNSTAWGSFRSFTSPSLRDLCEVVIVMHKGTGILTAPKGVLLADEAGKYSPFLQDAEYFGNLSMNAWRVKPETSLNGDHPAPFPVELVERLIHLYAYPGALIVDGMAGSGSVGVAAKKNLCRAVLVEQSELYCALARERVEKVK